MQALSMSAPEHIKWQAGRVGRRRHVFPQTDTGFKDASGPLTVQHFL